MRPGESPMDVVFTWVDDRRPGYAELLAEYSRDPRDLNPNRTRDNLELLRYALRSLDTYLPELRRVFLFSMRPQVPHWLDTGRPDVIVVHHDEVMAPEHLPTFNSFAIVSHLHLLPGIGPDFLYFEDDMLLADASAPAAFAGQDGRPRVLLTGGTLRRSARLDPKRSSPWNLALAQTIEALEARHGRSVWPRTYHLPIRVQRDLFAETMTRYAPEIATTRAARFRSAACVAPEVLYPLDTVARGLAQTTGRLRRTQHGYASLENFLPWTALQLAWMDFRLPKMLCLNDSFGARPNKRVEAYVRRWLVRRYPRPSRFERASTSA